MIRSKKIEGNIKEKLPALIETFRLNHRIEVFYLFGSYGRDEIKPLSDIDIAVLLKKNIPLSKYWDIKIDLLSGAARILGTEEIDLVLLNEVPCDLAYHILKDGKVLFCHDEKWRREFQEKTVLNYLDTQSLREEGFFHLGERIRKGRFGHDQGRYKEDFENVRRIFGEVRTHS